MASSFTTTTIPSTPATSRPGRPVLRHSSYHGGSFIQDHQQYKSPKPDQIQSIDGIVDLSLDSPPTFLTRDGVPKSTSPSRIKDSGIVHTMFNHSTSILSANVPSLVATIYYKSGQPVHPPKPHPDASPRPQPSDKLPTPSVPDGAAPTQDLDKYPLEPPPPQPEPLDHLYGSHVSELCLTHFLQIIENLQTPYQRISSSHRCLDAQVHPRVVEVTFSPPPNPEYLTFEEMRKHESIWRFEREWNVEVVLQKENVFRRYKRLAVFDMDSTLIEQEVIDEIARFIGVEKQVSDITARAMNGELDFSESLKARVALLKGVPADVFERLKPIIRIAPGARELCRALKKLGYKMAVLSGGFQPLADWLAGELGLDYAFANHLISDPETQTLTGNLSPDFPIVDASRKSDLLSTLAAEKNIPLSQTVAVGDGANDLLMLHKAGLGVAWNAKSKVQLEAPGRLNGQSLVDVLYLLGLSQGDVDELIKEN